MIRFEKAGCGVADQGGLPEPHCSLHAQGLKISRQTQGPELFGQGLNYQGQGLNYQDQGLKLTSEVYKCNYKTTTISLKLSWECRMSSREVDKLARNFKIIEND